MRVNALLVGLFIGSTIILTTSADVSAETDDPLRREANVVALIENEERSMGISDWITYLDSELPQDVEEIDEDELDDIEPKEPVVHIVESGESLTSIAKLYEKEWTDLWNKNESLENPDMISVGQEIVIPFDDEELESRPLPEPPVEVQAQSASPTPSNTSTRAASYSAPASSSANLYAAGNCTWYAKSRRPDLPNNLGNANTWVARAASQGIPTGSQPRVGAIGEQKGIMHVVYVEAVHDDGTVTVSEMNWKGLYIVSTRRVAASSFTYIY